MFLPVRLLVVLIAALLSCGSAYGADKREGIPPLLTGLQLERSLTFVVKRYLSTIPMFWSGWKRSCCCPLGPDQAVCG